MRSKKKECNESYGYQDEKDKCDNEKTKGKGNDDKRIKE